MTHKDKQHQQGRKGPQRHIQFYLGEESFVVELLKIKEFIPVPQTTSVPQSPDFFMGLMDLRGDVISIIDLRKILGINPREIEVEETVLIVDMNGTGVGLIVDFVKNVVSFDESAAEDVGELNFEYGSEHMKGVYKGPDGLAIILDLENLILSKNINQIEKAKQNKAA